MDVLKPQHPRLKAAEPAQDDSSTELAAEPVPDDSSTELAAEPAPDDSAAELAAQIAPDGTVQFGPFAGMWMGLQATWGYIAPYLAGTYEDELSPWIESEIERHPPLLINIGAAEGYYAVGFALRSPQTRVVASDVDARAQALCSQIAVRNGANVEIAGECTPEVLQELLTPGALVVCDCEGYEKELLDLVKVPSLAHATILVELHDFLDPTISPTILSRFGATHSISIQPSLPKSAHRYPHLAHLDPVYAWTAIQEHRPGPMEWAFMQPNP
jgi:hypothetical protein